MGLSQQRGQQAELMACRFLQQRGLRLLARNYRSRRGEIDIVMQDRDALVFVEVRYRHAGSYGHATESVTPHKQRRIIHCARCYLQQYRIDAPAVRFDVVGIELRGGRVLIDWIRDAFRT